ncbi:MAG: oxygen-independent coproporphyrinogen III oxidase [Candidatus Zixiibacteriota bacterium]
MPTGKTSQKSKPPVNRSLLRKYDRPGPRYTSYPTVPEWNGSFGPEDYIETLERASLDIEPLSLYIHIPFCRSRCFYCGCNTCVRRDDAQADRYLDAVIKELAMIRGYLKDRNNLRQLHWGGGTPTSLNLDQIDRLFTAISDRFRLESDAETAIEIDPRVTTAEQLELLARLGFNRVSLGVQDFTPRVQKAIGRNQTLEQTEMIFNKSRELGFSGINIDLIYGLPLQTVEDFTRTIEEVVRLGADRVAVYSYAHLPRLKPHQKNIDESTLPDASLKFDLFAAAVENFLKVGYIQIGMDHFARPDDELACALEHGALHRNFMGYTPKKTRDMLGVGVSAIGFLSDSFAQNRSELESYTDAVLNGRPAVYRGFRLSEDDKIRQWVILSLMCNFVLGFEQLKERFNLVYDKYFEYEDRQLKEFIDDGLLARDEKGIKVLPPGRIYVRNIAMVFDAYLRKSQPGQTPLFSRTI